MKESDVYVLNLHITRSDIAILNIDVLKKVELESWNNVRQYFQLDKIPSVQLIKVSLMKNFHYKVSLQGGLILSNQYYVKLDEEE